MRRNACLPDPVGFHLKQQNKPELQPFLGAPIEIFGRSHRVGNPHLAVTIVFRRESGPRYYPALQP
jgi:hypothetical protein